MAADQQTLDNPIFFEIPRGLKVEEVRADYRPIDVIPESWVPSKNVPIFNQLNPHHGLGDPRMKIYCRVQDADGAWWLAHKEPSTGMLSYYQALEMAPVAAKN